MSLYLKLFNKLKSSRLSKKQLFKFDSNSLKFSRKLSIKHKVLRTFKTYYFKNTTKLSQQLNQSKFKLLINSLIKIKLRLLNFLSLSLLRLKRIKNNFTQSKLQQMLKRLIWVVLILGLPFCILLKSLLFNLIIVGNLKTNNKETIVFATRFVLRILRNIPGSLEIVKIVSGISQTSLLLFFYFLVFSVKHKEFGIPYEIAYNGTLGFLGLSVEFLLAQTQNQNLIAILSDWIYACMQCLCYREVLTNLGTTQLEPKILDIARRFINLYLAQFFLKYNEFNYLTAYIVTSFLIILSLLVILYNGLHYVFTDKNPNIPVLTRIVRRSMTNAQGDVL